MQEVAGQYDPELKAHICPEKRQIGQSATYLNGLRWHIDRKISDVSRFAGHTIDLAVMFGPVGYCRKLFKPFASELIPFPFKTFDFLTLQSIVLDCPLFIS